MSSERSRVPENLGSKNGTSLRSARLTGSVTLARGDEIRLRHVPLTLRVLAAAGPTRTAT